LALVVAAALGCGSGGGNPAPAPAGPQDLSKLTPQQQLEKVQNDPSIPPQFKQTAINSIKQKYGLK
jgi:hypothetical protein